MQTLFYAGDILPMTGENDTAEAVITNDGKIEFVGELSKARELLEIGAEEVNLEGKTLMPAFIDAHSHIFQTAQYAAFADISQAESITDIKKILRQYKNDKGIKADGVIIATGYDQDFLNEKRHPNIKELDEVANDIPICLIHASGHICIANSALLKICNITDSSVAPEGGKYGYFENGSLNGYIEEVAAITPVLMAAFQKADINMAKQITEAQNLYLKYGISTVQEGTASRDTFAALKGLSDKGLLKLDTVAYIMSDEYLVVAENNPEYSSYKNNLKIGGAKLILDGSPQARSAYLSAPYENEQEYRGYPAHPQEKVDSAVLAAVTGGYQLLTHCNGDAASEQLIDAFSKCEQGKTDAIRPIMIHSQTVRADQLDRMTRLGILPSFFVAHTYFWGDTHFKNLGRRAELISPAKTALEKNLLFTFHQDTPVLPPDMLKTVWCAANRKTKSGREIGAAQAISVYEALKAVTVNAAYTYFEEDTKGSMEVGKNADFVILSENPLRIDKTKIDKIKILATIKNGVTLYKA